MANDPTNTYDAPIPGFTGPAGDGVLSGNVVNPAFLGWATSVVDYSPADQVIQAQWLDASKALGPVTGDNFGILCLGDLEKAQIIDGERPGSLTLKFDLQIMDGAGPDFALFENGFQVSGTTSIFAELAYVEVSSDGVNFLRFPSVSLTPGLVGAYGNVDATDVFNLVGKHCNAYGTSWGTPFDLSQLKDTDEVKNGLVDINKIQYVRVIDIPGSGDYLDSQNHPIYDAWVTWGSGGLDFEAAGVLNGKELAVTPSSVDMDANIDDGPTTFSITISNPGNAPVNFTKINLVDPMKLFTIVTPLSTQPLAGGESRTMVISVDPAQTVPYNATLQINSDYATNPAMSVPIRVNGSRAKVQVTPASIALGSVNVLSVTTTTLAVANTGTETPLRFQGDGLAIEPSDSGFSLVGSSPDLRALNPGASRSYTVAYTANVAKVSTATLYVTTGDSTKPKIAVPLSVKALGPELEVPSSGSYISIGNAPIGQTAASYPITIKNTGTTALTITSLTWSSNPSSQFSFAETPDLSDVAPGDSRTFLVHFTPQAYGSQYGSICLVTNDADDSNAGTVYIYVTGNGMAPRVAFSPSSTVAFGSCLLNVATTKTLTVSNTGQLPLSFTGSGMTLSGSSFSLVGTPDLTDIAAGGSRTFILAFTPTALGSYTVNLVITTNSSSNSSKTIKLTGTGSAITGSGANLVISAATVDFGIITPDSNPTSATTITLTNTGSADLVFTQIIMQNQTGPFWFTATPDTSNLPAGQSRNLAVYFNAKSVGDTSTYPMAIASNADNGKTQYVYFKANYQDKKISVSPNSNSFSGWEIGQSSKVAEFTISNSGSLPLTISNVTLSTNPSNQFHFVGTPNVPKTLAAGETMSVKTQYTAAVLGSATGYLQIVSDDPFTPTYSVSLNASGVHPNLQISPASGVVDFGSVPVDGAQYAERTVAIGNGGSATLTFSGNKYKITDPSGQFVFSSTPTFSSLAANTTQTMTLRFTPVKGGDSAATLTLTTDDADQPTRMISLIGRGAAPEIEITPTLLDFGDNLKKDATTGPLTVTVNNTGETTLTLSNVSLSNLLGTFAFSSQPDISPIPAGSSRQFAISVTPQSHGYTLGALRIYSDDYDEGYQVVTLTGSDPVPVLIAPQTLSFREGSGRDVDVEHGETATTATLTLSNAGDAPLLLSGGNGAFTGLSISGDAFSIVGTSPVNTTTLDSCTTMTVTVRFAPTVTQRTLGLQGSLVVTSNDPERPSVSIELIGDAVPVELSSFNID
jgi:hypothetical protein